MSEITNETSGEGTLTNDVNDCGSNPSELYGTFKWKVEKFSQINEREIRSDVFEVGGHRWYLLIYPRGCDVTNHLSMFLCVANYDKLVPGWSHLAQFTLGVENKDLLKSKYSDTIHQFWKKEHDWGWKKFIELPKLQDGFIDKFGDLVIKAQVQVIRECMNRPFSCIDGQYKKELVRVYSKNVVQIFFRFVEEKRSKFVKLIDDKKRWTSLCSYWLGIEHNSRVEMSREKKDVILKLVVKHFFIKNEVTSTLVMDSLFYGLKALEDMFPAPIANVDKDMFVVIDPLLLVERFVLAPLSEMCSPKLVQFGSVRRAQYNMERDEKQLADYGRCALEVFVLDHIICNKIEFAYEEAIALEKQVKLIHEEERKRIKVKNVLLGKL